MPDKKQKLDTRLFKLLFLVTAGIVVTQSLGQGWLTSYLFLLTFPLTVALWIYSVRRELSSLDLLMVGIVALAMLSVMINAAATTTMPSFGYIKKLIMFAMTLMFLQTCYRVRVDQSVVDVVYRVADILTIYFIFLFFADPAVNYQINGRHSAYLTFRFSNPNMTALFLACLYMLELYRLFTPEKWYWKLLHILMAVALAVFIVLTQSRNVLLILVVFTVICAVLILRRSNRLRLGKWISALIAVFPGVFVLVYVAIVNTPWINKVFAFLVGEGKGLDSRLEIWESGIGYMASFPFLGAYSEISNGTGTFQMHNTHLDIACSYGVPVLVLVCYLLWRYLNQQNRVYTNKESFTYVLGFACAILMGIGEAALFSGGLAIYVFVGGFLLMANHMEDKEERS